jgi:hypothetical protein
MGDKGQKDKEKSRKQKVAKEAKKETSRREKQAKAPGFSTLTR